MPNKSILLDEITIRTELRPGDIGFVTYLHGELYKKEYNYGIALECYVAEGLNEFYRQYDPSGNRVCMGEHQGNRVGFMLLMNRGEAAQLRYFIVHPHFRGIGLGNKLMRLYIEFMLFCMTFFPKACDPSLPSLQIRASRKRGLRHRVHGEVVKSCMSRSVPGRYIIQSTVPSCR